MLHTRHRHIIPALTQASTSWPVIGLLGLRQSGKSTLFRELQQVGSYVTLDDRDTLEDVLSSEKNFLLKLSRPLIIDEAQKAPRIFDAIKLLVDRERRPGSYFLTGSSQFSGKQGIRESLTGRIGLHYLFPMTLAETHQRPLESERSDPWHVHNCRFSLEDAYKQFYSGGLPVPLFLRDNQKVHAYFQSWMETTILRDAMRAFGRGYDSDIAFSILDQIARALKEGEMPTLKHFKQKASQLRKYLQALEDIFLLQRITPHSDAIGSDQWTLTDSGIASYLIKTTIGDGVELSLARIFCLKEIKALCEYSGKRQRFNYFKTARGSPVDLLWNDVAIKISQHPLSRIEYDLRPLRSAMKTLNLQKGIVLTATESSELVHEFGLKIKIVPWTHFS